MARGGPSPGAVILPKVQFEKVTDEVSSGGPPGVSDGQSRSFGCMNDLLQDLSLKQSTYKAAFKDNDGYPFVRPEFYIRHIEPLEIDLARQVEYDMDEQDQEWLEAVNVERRKEHLDKVSAETFEIVMDRLEKEWFDLTKNLPKSDLAMPSEDSTCAVCDDSEGENSNAIVFCDGCNLAVHQDCYGVPYIPEGQWLCRKCTVSPENPVQCYLCPNEGGAFKQTIHGEWVHLLCAIWVPETRVANEVFMEPITGIEKISKQRWKLRCSICEVREGACIQCAKSSCFVAFHATCARQEKLLMPMKTTQGSEPVTLQAFCERHLPKAQQDIRAASMAVEAEQVDSSNLKQSSKSARAYNKTYKPGPPIVPAIIVNRISQYIHKIKIRKKVEFVQLVCRYWSLKREARRGAPLLKRLHLEPWTAGGGKIQTVEEKRMKLEQLQSLRRDLVHIKMLTLLVKFRELRKLKQTEIIHQVLSLALFPHEASLRMALEAIMRADRMDYFKNPVNKNDVPDYFDLILNPMCWSIIENRLDKHEYWDVRTFKDDVGLVLDNAMLYNQPGTHFHNVALKIRAAATPILKELERLALPPRSLPEASGSSLAPVGDLESPLSVLELLFSKDVIQNSVNLELNADSITSLFNFELGRYKPPPPPSPLLPPKPATKKRDRRAEAERAKVKKAEAAAAWEAAQRTASSTPADYKHGKDHNDEEGVQMKVEADSDGRILDFREPRTRASIAAAVAFEKEAHGGMLPEGEGGQIHAEPLGMESEPEPGSSRPKKRPSMSLPPSSIPRVVDDIDNQGSFQLFNSGWILPPENRRHGRAPIDKHSLPPPRKKQKTDHPSSRLSIVSTAASDAPTFPSTPAPAGDEGPAEHQTKMEIDPFSVPPGQAFPPGASFDEKIIQRTATDASGRIVIEELDTPYTRRQKSIKKKAQKQKGGAVWEDTVPASGSAMSARPSSSAQPESVSLELPGNEESESELSELSELPSEPAEGAGSKKPEQQAPSKRRPSGARRGKGNRRVDAYESGTLVWAKAESYPWWPAVVFDADHPDVPPNVLVGYKETRTRRKTKLYIVRFYDRTNSWQFLARDKLQLLGEDPKLDNDMLASPSINQKWKSASIRQTCRDAYRTACCEMETKSDAGSDAEKGQEEGEKT